MLSVLVEDTDRLEWRGLRKRLDSEGEARRFMTNPEARAVAAVSFVSRFDLSGYPDSTLLQRGTKVLRSKPPGGESCGPCTSHDVVSVIALTVRKSGPLLISIIRLQLAMIGWRHAVSVRILRGEHV